MKFGLLFNNKRLLVIIAISLGIITVFSGYLYLKNEESIIRNAKFKEIESIGRLKTNQISNWYIDQIQDAYSISKNIFLLEKIDDWYNTKSLTSNKLLKRFLLTIIEEHKFKNILIVSPNQEIVISTNDADEKFDSIRVDGIDKSIKSNSVISSDLYLSSIDNEIKLDIFAPVYNKFNKLISVIILEIDPEEFLFPLVQSWPIYSNSSETLIFRKEKNGIVFLNELKHQKSSALKLYIPYSRKNVPAIIGALGKTGIVEGKDYRGINVIAGIYPIHETPWILISKIDKNEILVELRSKGLLITILSILSFLLFSLTLAFIYKNKQNIIFKELFLKEKELRENIELVKTTLYSIGDGVITTDCSGHIKNLNIIAEQLTGWKESEAINKSIDEVFNTIDEVTQEKIINPVERILKEGNYIEVSNHILLVSKDGKNTNIANSGAPIKDKNGNMIGAVLVFRDQSEEKIAKKALEESEHKLKSIFRSAPIGIGLETDRIIKEVNDQFCLLTGYSESEIIGQNSRILYLNDEDYNFVGLQKYKQIKKHGTVTLNTRWIRNNGAIIDVLLSSTPIDIEDLSKGISFTALNITDQIKDKEILKQSEEDYKTLFNHAHDPILVFRPDDEVVLDVNNRACEVYGFSKEEFIGLSLIEISQNVILGKKQIDRVMSEGLSFGFETHQFRKDKSEIIVEVNATKIKFKNQDAILSINRDITTRKTIEKQLKENEERLRLAMTAAEQGLFDIDVSTGNTITNAIYDEMLEYEPGTLNESFAKWMKRTQPDDLLKVLSGYKRYFSKMQSENSVEIRQQTKSGKWKWFFTIGKAIEFDSNGRPSRIIGIQTDITAKKRSEEIITSRGSILEAVASTANELLKSDDWRKNANIILERIGKAAKVCRTYLIENCKGNLSYKENFTWVNENIITNMGDKSKFEIVFDKWAESLSKGEIIYGNVPDFENTQREIMELWNIKSILIIPIFVRDSWWGVIGFDNCINYRDWNTIELDALKIAASLIGDSIQVTDAEIKLKESEERFKALINNSNDVILILDISGNFKYISPSFQDITGYTINEKLGRSAFEDIHPDDIQEVIYQYSKGQKSDNKRSPVVKYRYKDKFGKYIYIETIGLSLTTNPAINGILINARDITQRIEEEKIYRLYEHTVRNISESVTVTDINNNIIYVNQAFEKLYGYAFDEVYLKNISLITHHDKEITDKILNETIESGWKGELLNIKKDGTVFPIYLSTSKIYDEENNLIGLVGVTNDRTEKVKSENELNEYKLHLENQVEERTEQLKKINKKLAEEIKKQNEIDKQLQAQLFMLSTFIESMPTASFIKDNELKFIEVNHAFEELAGKGKDAIIGKTVFEVFPKKIAEVMDQHDKEILIEKNLKTFDMKIVDKNKQEKYYLIKNTIFQRGYGEIGGILGTYIDISENRKLQESIEKNLVTERELSELKSRFISMASHEFRTPLTSIRIFSDLILMLRDKDDKEKLVEYAEKIQNSVSYMIELINDVLTMSRVETGKLKYAPENVDIYSLFNDLLNEAKLSADKKHNFILNIKTSKKGIFADSKLLRYIISNLFSNAIKYSPGGGDIVITVDYKDPNLIFEVKDSGLGMSELVMKNLFEPFLRGDNIGTIQGTGLGLSIIKKAVDLHKGNVSCKSVLKKGTTFTITIPIDKEL